MGQSSRPKPERLAEKLLEIRNKLGLSQNGLIKLLGLMNQLTQARISAYERAVREPPLLVLLKYAEISGVYVDALINDDIDLPEILPANPKSAGIKRKGKSISASKSKKIS